MIKKIGQAAREDLESFFGGRVFLELIVRVDKNWSMDPRSLRRLGY
jgi:GTP-binding protein Era